MYKVYCYGMIIPSTVYILDKNSEYPKPNGYGEVEKVIPSVGGEAANTAIMLSKLGISSILDGTWILTEKESIIKEILSKFDIDISKLKSTNEGGPSEILIADGINRTSFGNFDSYSKNGKKWNIPDLEDIKQSSMVVLDPYLMDESIVVAQTCKKLKIPYVTSDSNHNSFIAKEAEVIVISQEHRDWNYPDVEADELFELYRSNCQGLVIFTFGSKNVWYGRNGLNKYTKKPFKINPIDTTAAGDTFRAGIIYGLLNDMSDEEIITFSNAVSGCVCQSVPHSINATDLKGVLAFLEKRNN